MEHCRFVAAPSPAITGAIVGEAKGIPVHLSYSILLNESYMAQEITIQPFANNRPLHLLKKEDGWYQDGSLRPEFATCHDIDIAETPATNTLPIQRLRLAKGESAAFMVIYIDPLGQELKVLEQKYTRLSQHRYFYENPSTAFQSEIAVDEYGVVEEYPGIWTRIYPQRVSQ